ncbi:GNAT family N-acetyltransferase [candidate division KSB1 bacterium]|nr:GNAT family N-acetyltransferase [candidate division KSB1 bacterium]
MEIIVKNPKDCSDAELESFENLVAEGGEVLRVGLRERIRRAEKLVFINADKPVAVGAIKNPNVAYKTSVFKKSGVSGQSKYQYEIGWLYVSKTARRKGYGRVLMDSIVAALADHACFATTREDNDSMHYLFSQFGFSKLGQPYRSSNGEYSLALYARP